MILGHLIGDFVLQTNRIAGNKILYRRWNILHALVVTLCTLFFALPAGGVVIALVLLNGGVHFFIDHYKPRLVKRFGIPEIAGFVLDQALHVLLLAGISCFAVSGAKWQWLGDGTIKVLFVLVFITSFCAVFNQLILGMVFPRMNSRFFEDGEKVTGIITRLYIAISLFLSYVLSPFFLLPLALFPVAFLLQNRFKWLSWMSTGHLAIKLLLDVLMALAGVCIIFL